MLGILISDQLVECEKIGAGNFYWSFFLKTLEQYQKKINQFEESIPRLTNMVEEYQQQYDQALVESEVTPQRCFFS